MLTKDQIWKLLSTSICLLYTYDVYCIHEPEPEPEHERANASKQKLTFFFLNKTLLMFLYYFNDLLKNVQQSKQFYNLKKNVTVCHHTQLDSEVQPVSKILLAFGDSFFHLLQHQYYLLDLLSL